MFKVEKVLGLVVARGTAVRRLRLPRSWLPQGDRSGMDERQWARHPGFLDARRRHSGCTCQAADHVDWYRGFLQFMIDTNSAGWFSYVIVFGELAVGVGLIVGAFVGLAAAGGLLMNFAFLLAGTTSTNPMFVMLGFLLILAWKNAGYIGLDYFLLPMLGTPWWKPGEAPTVATPARTPVAATH
jgi:hypothetical protein